MAQDFEQIIYKLLKDMQLANEKNSKSFDDLLNSLNTRLEKGNVISSDLLKSYIEDLSSSVNEKYSITLERFEAIEQALKVIYNNQPEQNEIGDLKEYFDLYSDKLKSFADDTQQEKIIISSIENKITELINNKSDKDEILRTISLLRNDFDNLNTSYKSIISDINNHLHTIVSNIIRLDPIKSNQEVKDQIEITFKSVNEVVNKLAEIEAKNIEIERVINNTATNEDLKVTKGLVDAVIEKTDSIQLQLNSIAQKRDIDQVSNIILDKSETLPTKENFLNLESSIHSLSDFVTSLRQELANVTKDIENIPTVDSVEKVLKTLYTQLDGISTAIESQDIENELSDTNDILDEFKEEIATVRDIVSDLNDVIHNRILTAIDDLNLRCDMDVFRENIVKELEIFPDRSEINAILQDNRDILEHILENTEVISDQINEIKGDIPLQEIKKISNVVEDVSEKISKTNLEKEFSKIYNKTNKIEEWLEKSNIKDNIAQTSELLKSHVEQNEILKIYEFMDQIVKDLQDLAKSTELSDINRKISDINFQVEEVKNFVVDNIELSDEKIISQLTKIEKNISNDLISANDFKDAINQLKIAIEQVINDVPNKSISEQDAILFKNEIQEQINKLDFTNVVNILNNQYQDISHSISRSESDLTSISEHIHKHLPVNFETIKTELTNIKQSIEVVSGSFNSTEIYEKFEELKEIINSQIENQFSEKIQDRIEKLESSILDCNTYNDSRFAQIINLLDNFNANIENGEVNSDFSGGISAELKQLTEQLHDIIDNLSKKESGADNSAVVDFLSDKLQHITSDVSAMSEALENRVMQNFNYNAELIEEKTGLLQGLITEISTNTSNEEFVKILEDVTNKLEDFKNGFELTSTDLLEHFDNNTTQIISQLSPILESVKDLSNTEIWTKLKENMEDFFRETVVDDNLLSEISKLKDLYKELSQSISDVENNLKDFVINDTDSILIKLDNLRTYLEDTLENSGSVEKQDLNIDLSEFIEEINKFKEDQNKLIKEGFSQLKDEISEQNNELKSLLTLALNHEEVITAIDSLKDSIKCRLSELVNTSESDKTSASDIISKDISTSIYNIQEDFKSFSSKFENLSCDNSELKGVLEALNNKLEKMSDNVGQSDSQEFLNKHIQKDYNNFIDILDSLKSKMDEFSNSVEKIIGSIGEKEGIDKDYVVDKICQNMQDNLDFSNSSCYEDIKDYFESIVSDLSDKINTLVISSDLSNKILSKVNEVDTKMDILAESTNPELVEDLYDALDQKISKKINEINTKLDVLANDDNSEILDELSESDMQITSMLGDLNRKIDFIYRSNGNFDEVGNLISSQRVLIDGLSPSSRIDTYRRCLDDLSGEISKISSSQISQKDLEQSLKEMKESIMSTVVTIFDQLSFIEESEDIKDFVEERTDEINKNIAVVTKQLQQISSFGDVDDYSYSMQDIETDLSKLRVALKNINEEKLIIQEGEFARIADKLHQITSSVDSLTQDDIKELKKEITNLKEQTQFLIATSDKSLSALSNGDFEDILNGNLVGKVDKVTTMLEKSANSDNVIRQSLIYMGEWIDSATESINKISENSEEIEKITEVLSNLKSYQQSQLDKIEKEFSKFSDFNNKLEEQTERIDRLEMNIDKILNALKNVDDTAVTKKIDKIEKQLSKLSTNIEKLASYVD